MDAETYDQTNELAENLFREIRRLQAEGRLKGIESKIENLLSRLPEGCSLSLNLSVQVFDENRDRALKASDTGIAWERGRAPYIIESGLAPAKYLVDGVMMKVPHDHCPNCWARWILKSRVKECSECGYRMGHEVKLLVDTNVCPRCEEGEISIHHPNCDHCGFVAEKNVVVWG